MAEVPSPERLALIGQLVEWGARVAEIGSLFPADGKSLATALYAQRRVRPPSGAHTGNPIDSRKLGVGAMAAYVGMAIDYRTAMEFGAERTRALVGAYRLYGVGARVAPLQGATALSFSSWLRLARDLDAGATVFERCQNCQCLNLRGAQSSQEERLCVWCRQRLVAPRGSGRRLTRVPRADLLRTVGELVDWGARIKEIEAVLPGQHAGYFAGLLYAERGQSPPAGAAADALQMLVSARAEFACMALDYLCALQAGAQRDRAVLAAYRIYHLEWRARYATRTLKALPFSSWLRLARDLDAGSALLDRCPQCACVNLVGQRADAPPTLHLICAWCRAQVTSSRASPEQGLRFPRRALFPPKTA